MSGLYAKARQKFLDGAISWTNDTIKCVWIDTASYTVNLSTHEYLSAVPSAARVGTPQTLTSKTSTDGVADAADALFQAVSGPTFEALLIYKDTGNEATSPLIAYFDLASPITPTGADITAQFSDGPNRIFKL